MSNFFPNSVCFRIYRCFIWQLYNFYLSDRKIKYNQAQDNLYLFLKTEK